MEKYGSVAYAIADKFALNSQSDNGRRHRGRRFDCPFVNVPCRPPVDGMVIRDCISCMLGT